MDDCKFVYILTAYDVQTACEELDCSWSVVHDEDERLDRLSDFDEGEMIIHTPCCCIPLCKSEGRMVQTSKTRKGGCFVF